MLGRIIEEAVFASKALVNDLDLEVESPDGTIYLGNDFANGRSTTGGTKDDLNNLEVVLIDMAMKGIWTVRVKDAYHAGSGPQAFAIAVSGQGVNDLRPDPQVVLDSMQLNVTIPQVGDQVRLTTNVFNAGNIKAESVDLAFNVNGVELDRKTLDINPGASRQSTWYWTPQQSGATTLELIIDPDDVIDEIQENNNVLTRIVDVTAPGVKVTADVEQRQVQYATQTTTSWNLTLENTALLETNASIDALGVYLDSSGVEVPWYLGMTASNFSLQGKGTADVSLTIVYPEAPEPGLYRIDVVGLDVDNGISYPLSLYLDVLNIPEFRIEYDYSIVPVHPVNPTNLTVRVQRWKHRDWIRLVPASTLGLECRVLGLEQRSWSNFWFNRLDSKERTNGRWSAVCSASFDSSRCTTHRHTDCNLANGTIANVGNRHSNRSDGGAGS